MHKRILYDITNINNKDIIIKKTTLSDEEQTSSIIDCTIIINEDTMYDIKINLINYPFKQPSYTIYPGISIEDDMMNTINGKIVFNDKYKQMYPCTIHDNSGFNADLEQIISVLRKYDKPIITKALHNDLNQNTITPDIIVHRDSLRKYKNDMVTLNITIIINNINYEIFMETIDYPNEVLSYRIFPIPNIKMNDMISFPNGWIHFKNNYIKSGFISDLKKVIELVLLYI